MRQKNLILVAGLVIVLVAAGWAVTMALTGQNNTAPTSSVTVEAQKGGQIGLPPVTLPVGPQEPTIRPETPTVRPVATNTPRPLVSPTSALQPSPLPTLTPLGVAVVPPNATSAPTLAVNVASPLATRTATAVAVATAANPTPTKINPPATATPAVSNVQAPNVPGIVPRKIRIPAIRVDTFVEQVGITAEGNMDVPKNIWNTAWLRDGGYRPGQPGNAVIAGHLDAPGTKAVFWDLDKLKAGDKLYVTDTAGKEMSFEVTDRQYYPYNNAPLAKIFGPSNEARLNLITCGGVFDRTSRSYNERLIIFTRLVSSN